MNAFRRVGLETGVVTDEELKYIDAEIIHAARPALRARDLFPIKQLPNAGMRTLRKYVQADMSAAIVTMNGEDLSLDHTDITEADIDIPVISKDFVVNWRDILAARHNNQPLQLDLGANAARQVAEEENFMLYTGETTAHPLLGIEGLLTATGRNTEAGGAWPANAIADVNDAKAELQTDGFDDGPYVLIGRVAQIALLDQAIAATNITYRSFLLQNKIVDAIVADDMVYSAADATSSAAVVCPGRDNFELIMGQDITTFQYGLQNMNTLFRVYEVCVPNIKRPESICELTGLS